MKKFPVLLPDIFRQQFPDCPDFIDWNLLNEQHARHVHSQTLQRLSERGGLSPPEIVGNIKRLEYWDIRGIDLKDSIEFVKNL